MARSALPDKVVTVLRRFRRCELATLAADGPPVSPLRLPEIADRRRAARYLRRRGTTHPQVSRATIGGRP